MKPVKLKIKFNVSPNLSGIKAGVELLDAEMTAASVHAMGEIKDIAERHAKNKTREFEATRYAAVSFMNKRNQGKVKQLPPSVGNITKGSLRRATNASRVAKNDNQVGFGVFDRKKLEKLVVGGVQGKKRTANLFKIQEFGTRAFNTAGIYESDNEENPKPSYAADGSRNRSISATRAGRSTMFRVRQIIAAGGLEPPLSAAIKRVNRIRSGGGR